MVTAIQDELKQKDESGSENGITGAGAKEAVTTAPATMGVGQSGKQGKAAKTGSGFVNLERYLVGNPNAGQQMASQISSAVKGAGEAYKTTGQGLVQGAKEYAAKDVTTLGENTLSKIRGGQAQTINPEDVKFSGLQGYTGSEAYGKQAGEFEKQGQTFRELAKTSETPSLAVPNVVYKDRPISYTSKMGALDTAFMAAPKAQEQFAGLKSYLGEYGKGFGGGAPTTDLSSGLASQLGGITSTKEAEAETTRKALQEAGKIGVGAAESALSTKQAERETAVRNPLIQQVKTEYKKQTGEDIDDATAAGMVSLGGTGALANVSETELANVNALRAIAGLPAIGPQSIAGNIDWSGVRGKIGEALQRQSDERDRVAKANAAAAQAAVQGLPTEVLANASGAPVNVFENATDALAGSGGQAAVDVGRLDVPILPGTQQINNNTGEELFTMAAPGQYAIGPSAGSQPMQESRNKGTSFADIARKLVLAKNKTLSPNFRR